MPSSEPLLGRGTACWIVIGIRNRLPAQIVGTAFPGLALLAGGSVQLVNLGLWATVFTAAEQEMRLRRDMPPSPTLPPTEEPRNHAAVNSLARMPERLLCWLAPVTAHIATNQRESAALHHCARP